MNSLIIGTAGHIDHGKTALIRALNGFEGDQTKEEKRRGITIDLSFSHLSRGEDNIAFINVPGHENLVKTMISGAFGFDACMLVVAANEGVMPQTREHLAVLNFLGVKSVILVITKCDLVSREAAENTRDSALEEIEKYSNLSVVESFLVSVSDPESITELKNYLFNLKPRKHDENGIFRYYIDRVFTLKGRGVIVTGSAVTGAVSKDEKLFCPNTAETYSVRSIEIHDAPVAKALSPNRVALALAGNCEKLARGQILSKKGFWRGFREADVIIEGEPAADAIFCVGSDQTHARILPIKDNFYKIKFEKDMFLQFDEPFVLIAEGRVQSGGRVLNPIAEPMKKALLISLLERLAARDFEGAFAILAAFHKHGFGLISAWQRFGMMPESATQIAKNLEGVLVSEDVACVYGAAARADLRGYISNLIAKNEFAIFSVSSVVNKLSWASPELAKEIFASLESEGKIEKKGGVYTKKGVDFEALKERLEEKILTRIKEGDITPEAPYNIYDEFDVDRATGDAALKKLTAAKKVVRLEHNLFIAADALNAAMTALREIIKTQGKANVTNVKERLGISRKYALAYLAHLDKFEDIRNENNDRFFV